MNSAFPNNNDPPIQDRFSPQAQLFPEGPHEPTAQDQQTQREAERVERMVDAMQARADAFEEELEALPQVVPCPRHPRMKAVLARAPSFTAMRPIYECPCCQRDARMAVRRRVLTQAGVPADVLHATFWNFALDRPLTKGYALHTPQAFLQACQKFAAGEVRNLILCGSPGIGKGHLAAAIIIPKVEVGESARWINCLDLFRQYHAAYEDHRTEQVLRRCVSPALLVLDEICLRDLPADGEEILFTLLDRRQKAQRQTLLLGNRPADEVRQWLGGRITDRLRSGGVTLRYGEWESLRGSSLDGAVRGRDGDFL